MEFILVLKSKGVEPSPKEMQELLKNYLPWMQNYTNTGSYIAGSPFQKKGAFLKGNGQYHFEGDFLKGSNLITGYIHLKATSLEDAVMIADECPLLAFNDIVVMPILEM